MHRIKMKRKDVRTDLIDEKKVINQKAQTNRTFEGGKVISYSYQNYDYHTIYFTDITDQDSYQIVLKEFVKELQKIISIKKDDVFLVIGLGNEKSTPDSLGPEVINHILVTKYLFDLGEVEEGYSSVCSFVPNVTGNTGIETSKMIQCIIKESNASKVILIDALRANHLSRLLKTIQITNQGISPGSGVFNDRFEISKETMGVDVVCIGVPTIVDLRSVSEKVSDNFMVTPTDIDFLIERLGLLLGEGINKTLHQKRNTTK